MKTEEYTYDLPRELIAQYPLQQRDASRLLAFFKDEGRIEHRRFNEIADFFKEGDLLVLNDTKVIPARLLGKKETGGKVEVLLAERLGNSNGTEVWKTLINPSKSIKIKGTISFGNGLNAEVVDRSDGLWKLVFSATGRVRDALEQVGTMPLPPYINRLADERDNESYQTVFAKREGAIAAPTAGLHFTTELLTHLEDMGVDCRFLTLHVGPGTFLPVKSEHVKDHSMLPEYYEMDEETFEAVKDKKAKGERIIAVGSTATRALEASVVDGWEEPRINGLTDLFIYPGYKFKVISGMITNFHLPRSTLLMLVAALIGRDAAMTVYNEALKMRYRFYSYGDAMMII